MPYVGRVGKLKVYLAPADKDRREMTRQCANFKFISMKQLPSTVVPHHLIQPSTKAVFLTSRLKGH